MDPDGVVLGRVLLHELGVAPIAEESVVFCRKDALNQCKLVLNENLCMEKREILDNWIRSSSK